MRGIRRRREGLERLAVDAPRSVPTLLGWHGLALALATRVEVVASAVAQAEVAIEPALERILRAVVLARHEGAVPRRAQDLRERHGTRDPPGSAIHADVLRVGTGQEACPRWKTRS